MCFIPLTDSNVSSNAVVSFSMVYFDQSILRPFILFGYVTTNS